MKKTGIEFMITVNLLYICLSMKIKITGTTAKKDDPEINMEFERELIYPNN